MKGGGRLGWLGSALVAVGLVLVVVGERVLGENRALGTGTGLLVLAAALALRAHAFVRAQGDARAVEGRLLAAYAGIAAGLGLYGLTTTAGVAALEMLTRLGGDAERGRVATVLLLASLMVIAVSASIVLFIELAYQSMPIAASVELRRVRKSLHAGASLSLAAIFALSIGYVATERNMRKDVSYFRTTEPSSSTLSMVRNLDQPVRALLFYPQGSDVLSALRPYFDALASSGKLSVEARDVALEPALAHKHRVRDNGTLLLVQGEGEAQRGEQLAIGVELTAARRSLRTLDGLFQQTFTKLVRPPRGLAITVGHGERNAKSTELDPGDGTVVMREVLKRLNLQTEDIGLSQGLGSAVPSLSTAVLIVGPTEKFLPEEAASIIAYLKKGGRLLLMVDPDLDVGLAPVLDAVGLSLLPGVLTSETHHMVGRHNASDRSVVYTAQFSSHPTVTSLLRAQHEVATVFYKGGALAKAAGDSELKPRVVFPLRTAGTTFRDLNANFTLDPGESVELLQPVAAATLSAEDGKEGRVVVIADGDFMTDKLAQNRGNYLLFVDALAWLVGNEELPAEVSSEEDVPIEHSRQDDQIWFYATTFAAPVPVALLGLWVSRRRRKHGGITREPTSQGGAS